MSLPLRYRPIQAIQARSQQLTWMVFMHLILILNYSLKKSTKFPSRMTMLHSLRNTLLPTLVYSLYFKGLTVPLIWVIVPLLFQGQVTRAQEAEENYVIKRELAVVRQQCNTASESLEKAQDTIRELQQQRVNTNQQSVPKQCGSSRSSVSGAGDLGISVMSEDRGSGCV